MSRAQRTETCIVCDKQTKWRDVFKRGELASDGTYVCLECMAEILIEEAQSRAEAFHAKLAQIESDGGNEIDALTALCWALEGRR